MNNLIATIILSVAVGLMMIYGLSEEPSVNAQTVEDIKTTIQRVAEDYRKEQGFNGQCYIAGEPVTLAQMIYGLGVAEGGFNPGSAGLRTNNPGSLRKGLGLKKVVATHHIDNTKTRPEYATMYDGLYEKAHLIASPDMRYKCNYTFESAFAYTSGPNAERTEARVQNARNHLNNALRGARNYQGMQEVATQEVKQSVNYYQQALEAEQRKDQLFEELQIAKGEAVKAWGRCKEEGVCKE